MLGGRPIFAVQLPKMTREIGRDKRGNKPQIVPPANALAAAVQDSQECSLATAVPKQATLDLDTFQKSGALVHQTEVLVLRTSHRQVYAQTV